MDMKIHEVCRACMSKRDNSFDENMDFAKMSDKTIDMFTFCTSIEVLQNDGLPMNMCQQCLDNIHTCYNFINICKSTDHALKKYVQQGKELQDKGEQLKIEKDIKEEEPDYSADYIDQSESEDERIVDIKHKILDDQSAQIENNNKVTRKKNKTSKGVKKKRKRKRKEELEVPVEYLEDNSERNLEGNNEKSSSAEGDVKKLNESLVNKTCHKKSYTCLKCSEVIVGLTAFNKHRREVHMETKLYKCDGCDKTFEKHRSMISHLKIHDRPYKCKICPDDFKRKDKLKLHIIMCHTTERPFKCSLCPLSFKTKEYLKLHSFLHQGDKRYLCEYCGASFNSAQGGTLKIHIRTHTGEKPYHCKECPKVFRTVHQLYKHEKTHANMRTYKCSFCHKGFNHRASMVVHERIHTGERPYKCEFCSRAFIDNWKRKVHLVSAHNIPKENIHCGAPGKRSKYYQAQDKEDAQQGNVEDTAVT